ncbi:sensor domain-containing diguanylate cyclase [Leeia sp. TBRC 13508]|uniref:Sensor domain-containing diguanylate cyclase n=1 Tax=Leeia speluncae TaxID=2884804 RepID=A0ABS8DAS8_9NEIS|nr:sensor domain-containing diguanylate cyclase [Leeia speluncae]MCB6185311.1 sensor domain-containing diguanylate cyclase [Leeia speluncae]
MHSHDATPESLFCEDVIDAVTSPILVCHTQTGKVCYFNAAAKSQLALTDTPAVDQLFERSADWRELLLRLKTQGHLKHFEARLKGNLGRDLWALISAKTYKHNDIAQPLVVLSLHDITEYRKREFRLQANEALHLQILRCSSEGYIQFDTETNRIIDANPAMCDLLKQPSHKVIGATLSDFLSNGSSHTSLAYRDWTRYHDTLQEEIVLSQPNGQQIIAQANANVLKNEQGEVITAFALMTDITERKKNEERMVYLAFYDSLTALPNRLLFQERLQQALFQQTRYGAPFSLFFLDLDNFKQINDTLGHDAGDAMLKQIAKRLFRAVRESDTVARIGGDEFLIILHGISQADEATIAAKKLLDALQAPIEIGQHQLQASVSIGITLVPKDGIDATTLRKKADLAMYQAKALGKNTYALYQEDDRLL